MNLEVSMAHAYLVTHSTIRAHNSSRPDPNRLAHLFGGYSAYNQMLGVPSAYADEVTAALRKFIGERLTRIESGIPAGEGVGKGRPMDIANADEKYGVSPEMYRPYRRVIIGREIVASLKRLNAVNPGIWSQLRQVDDPVLTDIMDMVDREGGIDRVFPDDIAETIRVENPWWHHFSTYPPLTLVTLLEQQPQLASQLAADSAVFPHHFFSVGPPKSKKEVITEMDNELAAHLVAVRDTEWSAELRTLVEEAQHLITTGGRQAMFHLRGARFNPSPGLNMKWANAEAARRFQELFGSTKEEQRRVKKELFEAFAEASSLRTRMIYAARLSPKDPSIAKSSKFQLAPQFVGSLLRTLRAYAQNQVLSVWKGTGVVPSTSLMAHTGVKAAKDGDRVAIWTPYQGKYWLTQDSRFESTDQDVVLMAAMLGRWTANAGELANTSATPP